MRKERPAGHLPAGNDFAKINHPGLSLPSTLSQAVPDSSQPQTTVWETLRKASESSRIQKIATSAEPQLLHRQVCKPVQWTGKDTPPWRGKLLSDSLKGSVEKRNCQVLESLFKPSSLQVRQTVWGWGTRLKTIQRTYSALPRNQTFS